MVEDIVEALSHHEMVSSRPSTAGSSHHHGRERPLSGKLLRKGSMAGGNNSLVGTRRSSLVSQGSNAKSMLKVTIAEAGVDDKKVMSKQGSVASMKSQASFKSVSKSFTSGKGEKASEEGKKKGEIGVRRNTEREAEANALLGGKYEAGAEAETLTIDDEVNPKP